MEINSLAFYPVLSSLKHDHICFITNNLEIIWENTNYLNMNKVCVCVCVFHISCKYDCTWLWTLACPICDCTGTVCAWKLKCSGSVADVAFGNICSSNCAWRQCYSKAWLWNALFKHYRLNHTEDYVPFACRLKSLRCHLSSKHNILYSCSNILLALPCTVF